MPQLEREFQPKTVSDVTTADSDKTFTVPANCQWKIAEIWVELTSTATVGNRVLAVDIQTSGGTVIGGITSAAQQAASKLYQYSIAPENNFQTSPTIASPAVIRVSLPISGRLLDSGQKIRVYEIEGVDAAADDMLVYLTVHERSKP